MRTAHLLQGAAVGLLLLTVGTALFAMGRVPQEPPVEETGEAAHAVSPAPRSPAGAARIGDLLAEPGRYSAVEVVVRGRFGGWQGSCPSSAMLTRSDWILKDQTGCIYVAGRLPDGLSPQQPGDEQLEVRGQLLLRASGKPGIQATETAVFAE